MKIRLTQQTLQELCQQTKEQLFLAQTLEILMLLCLTRFLAELHLLRELRQTAAELSTNAITAEKFAADNPAELLLS